SLNRLQRWANNIEDPLSQLAILEKDGDLLVRVGGALADGSGQLLLDFGEDDQCSLEFARKEMTADDWFHLGRQQEEARRLDEAEAAFRKALLIGGPDAVCCYNLGNVLYAQDRKQEAAERFYQAVEIDGGDPDSWNNLGTTLGDLGRFNEAKE